MGCVLGPGERLPFDELDAVLVSHCMECGKSVTRGGIPDLFSPLDGVVQDDGVVKWGRMCKKHQSLATHHKQLFEGL